MMEQLDRLVGTWKVTGGVEGTVRYEWMEGGNFLFQHVDLGEEARGLEVIGHEKPLFGERSEDVKSRFYGQDGATLDYVYEPDGDTLTIWGRHKGSPAYFRGTWNADGTVLVGAWVYPDGGGYESTMTRIEG